MQRETRDHLPRDPTTHAPLAEALEANGHTVHTPENGVLYTII